MIHSHAPSLTSTVELLANDDTVLLLYKLRRAGIRVLATEHLSEAIGAASTLGLCSEDVLRGAQTSIRAMDVVSDEFESKIDKEWLRLSRQQLGAAVLASSNAK
jgi:uncharacterized protein with von Willebrand factor type A (vWA) domain